ncbi:MAG: hypothetical protein KKB51_18210, partial [Candidatus Riflebacteria bacterium]|nr:hypothetical protein [Candidatus Riflebacteria bacterium]
YPKLSLYPTEITTAYTVSAWQNPSSLVIAPSGTCTVTPSVTASPWPLNHEMTIYNRAATATVTFESVSIAAGTNATFMQTATGTAANTWIKLK